MTFTSYRIRTFDVPGLARFFAVIGFVWGLLAGILILASYVQGYLANNDLTLIGSGLIGSALMVLYGIVGGSLGGALIAFLYNRVLGSVRGIGLELETTR